MCSPSTRASAWWSGRHPYGRPGVALCSGPSGFLRSRWHSSASVAGGPGCDEEEEATRPRRTSSCRTGRCSSVRRADRSLLAPIFTKECACKVALAP